MKKLIIVIILLCFLFIMGIVAAITITIRNRQVEVATEAKIQTAVLKYERTIELYMMKNNTKNIGGLLKNDCKELYLYIQNTTTGCSFTASNGTFWMFNQDGTTTISVKAPEGKRQITLGVCKDGTINCPEEFPSIQQYRLFKE